MTWPADIKHVEELLERIILLLNKYYAGGMAKWVQKHLDAVRAAENREGKERAVLGARELFGGMGTLNDIGSFGVLDANGRIQTNLEQKDAYRLYELTLDQLYQAISGVQKKDGDLLPPRVAASFSETIPLGELLDEMNDKTPPKPADLNGKCMCITWKRYYGAEINKIIDSSLVKVTEIPSTWEILYKCTNCDRFFELSYPNGERHGTGEELRKVTDDYVRQKYGI